MEIFPIWKTSYYPTTESDAVFRIMKWGTQEIYRGRGRRYPDGNYLDININKPTQNALDSMIWEALGASGDTVALSNGYAEFSLDFLDTSTDIWTTVYQFAMVNDWSYEEHEGNIYSDPINGHACPGMVLPYSYLVTGDTAETICYEEVEFDMPYIILTPATLTFNDTGGTLTFEINTNAYWKIYSNTGRWNFSTTEGNSGTTTITVTTGRNPQYNDIESDIVFKARNEYGITSATLHIIQEGSEPYLNITGGDGAIFNGHGTGWTLTYDTNVMPAYYELSGSNGYFVTGWTNGGSVTVPILGSLTGDTYEIKFYTEPEGDLLDTATATQQGTGEYFTILSGNGTYFNSEGGTWTITYDTNVVPTYYEFYNGANVTTGYTSGGTLTITVPPSNEDKDFQIKFYNEDRLLLETAYGGQGESKMYLYFDILTGGTITLRKWGAWYGNTIHYSKDNGATWDTVVLSGNGEQYRTIYVNEGDRVLMWATGATYGMSVTATHPDITNDPTRYNVSGNILAMQYGDTFREMPSAAGYSTYQQFFEDNTCIVSAEKLVMPEAIGYKNEYGELFLDCYNMTTAPVLPATALTEGCYGNMFENCKALVNAPVLPATTVPNNAYARMFAGCDSLETAPNLPATTIGTGCYKEMFLNCINLVNVPRSLPSMTAPNACYYAMFENCRSLATAPALPATALSQNCYYGMFVDCASLLTAPDLPATDVIENCYAYMFAGTCAVEYIKCLAERCIQTGVIADPPIYTATTNWTNSWGEYETSGTFVKSAAADWAHPTWGDRGVSNIPRGWTVLTA